MDQLNVTANGSATTQPNVAEERIAPPKKVSQPSKIACAVNSLDESGTQSSDLQAKDGKSGNAAPTESAPVVQVRPRLSEQLDPKRFPHQSKSGGVRPTLQNFRHMLKMYGIVATYDLIKKRLTVRIPGQQGTVDNHDNVTLAKIISVAILNGMPTEQIPAFLLAIGDANAKNVVADWIMGKQWDGQDRLESFYATLVVREDYPETLKRILLYRWLLSAVAAALIPHGFHCRGVLVLQGDQGIGKTQFFAHLVDDTLLRDLVVLVGHRLDATNKDSITSAITHWIVELGELEGSLKKDIASLKSFITKDSDKVRRPYGRTDSEYQRRTVFGATVNDANFLVDETGNSRFWTIAVKSINYEHGIDMQQLFAQLAVDVQDGAQWWLTKDEEMQLSEVNLQHRVVSLVRERILSTIAFEPPPTAPTSSFTALEMLEEAGIEHPTNAQCKECGSILREIYGQPRKVKGRTVWRVVLASPNKFGTSSTHTLFDDDDEGPY